MITALCDAFSGAAPQVYGRVVCELTYGSKLESSLISDASCQEYNTSKHKSEHLCNFLLQSLWVCVLLCSVNRLFDPEAVKAHIANLLADRQRIDQAVNALQTALRNIESLDQREFSLEETCVSSDVTLHEAVKRVCLKMIDGMTRQRVVSAIEKTNHFLKPKPPSVAASLINLTKGDHPMLKVAIEGRGRSPAYYSTEGTTVHRLSADEIETLLDETAIRGIGGWQSFWMALQKQLDKATGSITLSPELRAKIYNYYHSYGQGGWQNRLLKVFRRELPHLFIA